MITGKHKLSNEEYHQSEGISSSSLKILDESPMHYERQLRFHKQTSSLSLGTLIHTLVLEPEKFDDTYVVSEKFDLRKKDDKERKVAFEKENNGKIIIDSEMYDKALFASESVIELCHPLVKNGESEMSFYANYNGISIKCRPDHYIENSGIIVDLKTISDISDQAIKRSILLYKYHWSAAFYLKVMRELGYKANNFIFIFVETTEPFFVKIRELDENDIIDAEIKINEILDKYIHYKRTGISDFYKKISLKD